MVLETTSKTDQYNCTISNNCLQDGAGKNAAKTGTPRARRAVPERAVPPHPGRRCSRRRPRDCPRSHERGSQPRRAGWPREPQRRRLLDGPAARAAEPPAGGAWTMERGAMHKPRGRRWQRAARGACLRACAIAGAAGLGGAMRANGAPTRPQAASGGMGAGAPHESARRWRPQRRWLRRPQAVGAADADRAPPSPALGYGFPVWAPKGREGDGGSERSERRGKGERAATRRARIKARPLGRATAYPIGWAGWGMVPARQAGPRQETSISARLGLYRRACWTALIASIMAIDGQILTGSALRGSHRHTDVREMGQKWP